MNGISESIIAFLISALLVLLLGPIVIPALRRLRFGQVVREDGPKTHLKKMGTPTMGGLMIVASIAIVSLLRGRPFLFGQEGLTPEGISLLAALGITLFHGFLGFADDYVKVVMKRPLGLRARQKLAGQLISSVLLTYIAVRVLGLGTSVTIPFLAADIDLGPLYYVLAIIAIVGTTNAVNITDGADGLLSGASVSTFGAFALVALATEHPAMAVFSASCAGAALGFLWHNSYPARVIMGDTGSLALGAALVAIAIFTKTELLLPVLGGLYVIEALSVMIQVTYFKSTGKRIFKMAPIHHHYELLGYKETTVVFGFWLVSLLFGVLGLLGLRGLGR